MRDRVTYRIGASVRSGVLWGMDGDTFDASDRLLVGQDGTSDVFSIWREANEARLVAWEPDSEPDPDPEPEPDPQPAPDGEVVWRGDGTEPLNVQWAEISNADQPGNGTLVTSSSKLVFPSSRLSVDESMHPPGLDRSLRFTVFDGDNSYGERCEVGQGNPFRSDWDVPDGNRKAQARNPRMWYRGDDYWIASQIFVPAGFPTPSWQALHQFKHIDGGDGGPLVLELVDDGSGPKWGWSSSNSRDYLDSSKTTRPWRAPCVFDVWTRWLFHIKFSDDPQVGFAEVWADVDGRGLAHVLPRMHTFTMTRDERTGILKPTHARIGVYRNPVARGTSTAWIAGFNVATTEAVARRVAALDVT